MNKKGWTLVGELIAFLIAVILLVYSIYGLNRMGLVRDINKAVPLLKPELIISGKNVNYDVVESDLIEATKKYVLEQYNNDFSEGTLIVRISHLIKNNYISTIRDNKNKTCSGYVKVIRGEYDLTYTPYLKCSEYVSAGYEAEYDW
jgi:hypothetical protein